jgi:thiol-disulfide isomerase/thioredoxin
MTEYRKLDQQTIAARFVWLWIFLIAGGQLFADLEGSREVMSARARLKLIRSPEIQEELLIDPQQVQAIAEVANRVDLPLWKLRDRPIEQQSSVLAVVLNKQLKEGLAGILRPEQTKRLDQLALRLEGWRTLQLPSVVGQLDLSRPQKLEYAQFMAGFLTLKDKTLQSINLAEYGWIQRVLTLAQREQLGHLLGQPFNFSRCSILEVKAPEIQNVDEWINSPPLEMSQLRGKVVIVNFWTHGCINCIHNLPHYRKWQSQLPRDRVVMIAFHTPETEAEYDIKNLKQAVKGNALDYPIAVDNQKENWNAWGNSVWPSVYLVDKKGYVRNWWYGELNWQGATGEAQMTQRIYQLMAENESKGASNSLAQAFTK